VRALLADVARGGGVNETWLWLIWLGFFVAIEGQALFDKEPSDTLSEHVWAWFAIKTKPKWWRARRFVLLAFMTWLSVHFLTGGEF
jgi:hypothetical protein